MIASASATAVILSVGLYFFLSSPDSSSPSNLGPAGTTAGQDASQASAAEAKLQGELALRARTLQAAATAPEVRTPLPKIDPKDYRSIPPMPSYEEEILALGTRADLTDVEKAKAMLARMGSLPPEGQVFALEHAAELIPDENYVQLRPTLFAVSKNAELRETVLVDVLTRGDDVRMPSLVEMLRQPANPGQAEIREILAAYLDEELGNEDPAKIDPAKLDVAVKKFLAANSQE